jgi:hypothetical protein
VERAEDDTDMDWARKVWFQTDADRAQLKWAVHFYSSGEESEEVVAAIGALDSAAGALANRTKENDAVQSNPDSTPEEKNDAQSAQEQAETTYNDTLDSTAETVGENLDKLKDSKRAAEWTKKKFLSERLKQCVSPAVQLFEFNLFYIPHSINVVTPGEFRQFVESVSVNESMEDSSATVTMSLRTADVNNDFLGAVNSKISGTKPIWIRAQDYDDNDIWRTIFRGFTNKRDYIRPSASNEQLTFHCISAKTRAAEQHAIKCLPIFDGWCHLAAFYYIARSAGYSDDEIVCFSDDSTKVTLAEVLKAADNDTDAFKGPCFEGHTDEFPKKMPALDAHVLEGHSLDPAICHATLMHKDIVAMSPTFMFKQDATLWDCMQQIADYSGFTLFANRYGEVVYQPMPTAFSVNSNSYYGALAGGKEEFGDIPSTGGNLDVNRWNSYKGSLNVNYDDENTRNVVCIMGTKLRSDFTMLPMPITTFMFLEDWPDGNQDANTWAPWLKIWLERQPELFDPTLYKGYVDEIWKRATCAKISAKFTSWGAARFLPHQVVTLYDNSQTTGIDGKTFVIVDLSHEFNAQDLSYNIQVSAEYLDTETLKFMPHWGADKMNAEFRSSSEGIFNFLKKMLQAGKGANRDWTVDEMQKMGEAYQKMVQGLQQYSTDKDIKAGTGKFGE